MLHAAEDGLRDFYIFLPSGYDQHNHGKSAINESIQTFSKDKSPMNSGMETLSPLGKHTKNDGKSPILPTQLGDLEGKCI